MSSGTFTAMAGAVIFFWAVWCIFCKHVNDGIFGKIIYSFAALSAFALLMHPEPSRIIDPALALNWAFAMLAIRQLFIRYVWPRIRKYFTSCERCHHRRAGDC